MRKWWSIGLLIALAVVAASGLGRVKFDTDVLAVLPDEMPEVEALQAFQRVFSKKGELILLIEGDPDEVGPLDELAGDLAGRLKEARVSEVVRWRPLWQDRDGGMTDLIAWLWLNGDPQEVAGLVGRLSEDQIEATMEGALERVATSLDGGDLMMSAHDPFGFLDHPSLRSFFEGRDGGGEGFLNEEGTAQLMFIEAPRGLLGYREAEAWLTELKEVSEPWAKERGLSLGYTGDPAFEAEIGGAMEGDMRGTVGITSMVIGLLFLLMQRRFGLLFGMGATLGVIFAATLGAAGWIFGELSIMAAGFAAILIGLSVDYGVLICQEAKVAGHEQGAIRKAVSRSILYAAATTAAVFFALNLSGLPGIAQLGSVVGIGVIFGALFMLGFYLPWVAKVGAGRPIIAHKAAWLPGRKGSLMLLAGVLVIATGVLLVRGLPGVEFDRSLLRPRDSQAMGAFEEIQAQFPAWGAPSVRLVIEGGTNAEVRQRAAGFESRVAQLRKDRPDLVGELELPSGWWPAPEHHRANAAALAALGRDAERLLAAADEGGFSEEGTALGKAVLSALPRLAGEPPGSVPDEPATLEILRAMAMPDADGGGYILGKLDVIGREDLTVEDLEVLRGLLSEGVHLAGWDLLKPAVLPLVKKDLLAVFLPMVGLMVVMLSLVFRRAGDVVTALLAMSLSGILLLALMRITGLEWNFLNIAATPLLLGTGLDYAIHILLSLRRTGGDVRAVWNGTGKAVLFCGCSTAIGFGSLGFASIDALASLGKVAVLGILSSMLVAVILIPGLRGGRQP
ncbi:MMPL family transporter [Haloferula sp. A504]|uniref:MMPL family transporter n=1 Tax=Haloferula sp. A504 TaxID=3373601 RepID=UPI0031C2D3BC|nr:MMPL family transporter [Verrucomicrobiaceae bacterium E54]